MRREREREMGNQVFLCGCPFLNSSTQVSFLVCVLFVKPRAWDQSQGLNSRGGEEEMNSRLVKRH